MNYRISGLAVFLLALSGCVVGYTMVEPGTATIENMMVSTDKSWSRAPRIAMASDRKGSETWTQNGPLLDRLVFIPAVPNGEPLLLTRNKEAALPVFRADMLPNEIEELVESTLVKYIGEGQAAVTMSNLRPHRYGDHNGLLMNFSALVTESPEYRGIVGSFVADDQLYMMWYFGATPYYYDQNAEQAEAIIKSARLSVVQ